MKFNENLKYLRKEAKLTQEQLADIGNDDKQMWFCHQFLRIFVGEVVMFMVKVILFFIINYMLSLTLNVALAAVLYKSWVDKQLHK